MKNKKIETIRDILKRKSQSFTNDERALMEKYNFNPDEHEVMIITPKYETSGQRINPTDQDFKTLEGLKNKLDLHVINVRVLANE